MKRINKYELFSEEQNDDYIERIQIFVNDNKSYPNIIFKYNLYERHLANWIFTHLIKHNLELLNNKQKRKMKEINSNWVKK